MAYFQFLDVLGVESTVTFTLGSNGFAPTDTTSLGPFITVGGTIGSLALADLQDGSINFSIAAPSTGSITLLGASLVAQVSGRSEGVADSGATIGLLGVGLLGLGSFSLRKRTVA